MPITRCRRNTRRYEIPEGTDGTVRFDYPANGPSHELSLVDISLSSISFSYSEASLDFEAGSDVSRVRIRVGPSEMRGDLVVMHVTPTASGTRCGAMFYPASDEDLVTLREVVAELDELRPD